MTKAEEQALYDVRTWPQAGREQLRRVLLEALRRAREVQQAADAKEKP